MRASHSSKVANLAALEAALGHTFARPELLIQALTHRSQAFESVVDPNANSDVTERTDNERLEFLGDAVLGVVVAESLFHTHPGLQEGELTRLRAQLVSRRHMAEVAQAIGLGDHLLLGKGEERSGGRKKVAILANAMEAVIAAIFLDVSHSDADTKDGSKRAFTPAFDPIRHFARQHILGAAADDLAKELRSGEALGDHKSALQEQLQATHSGVPVYRVESESGPDHRKRYQVGLRVKSLDGKIGDVIASGNGSTKKQAEQEAARRGLQALAASKVLPGEPATA
jgi:ribonuclease-3